MQIGFIGTGVMGSAIVSHLLAADYDVNVFSRTKEKAMPLVDEGALWEPDSRSLAESADIIFTMLGYPSDVEDVYFGEDGVFAGLSEDKIVVDMTTSTPALATEITNKAEELGSSALDAPVSGGDRGAHEGTLTVMVGGAEETYEKVRPLFEEFASDLRLFGEAGSGQHTKMANQIMVAGTMTGMTEMLVYAKEAGLELSEVVKTVNGGAGQNWSLGNYAPRILQEDYSPGFFVKHFVKDLKIALDEADRLGLDLPNTQQAYRLYKQLEGDGHANDGTQSLIALWWE